jgi:UPF0271 protein
MNIDLNADIGESLDVSAGGDDRLLRTITSANVACGYHAGDSSTMRHTVRTARVAGVSIGAHPGFPDRAGFGRSEMSLTSGEIIEVVLAQLRALHAIAVEEGATLRHVKPHGALYNMSVRRADVADAIARAVSAFDRQLRLVGLPGSELLTAGARLGLPVAAEGFADRSYESDGSLTPRDVAGAVLSNAAEVAARAVRMVRSGTVIARDGSTVAVKIQTICVHGDTPGAAEIAEAVRANLEESGVDVKAL